MEEHTIKVIVATHKPYEMPTDDMYLPVHVGAAGKESIGYQRDDEGDNISNLNPYFCELTGLYWGWKNLNEDYIGLVHYRRHFALKHARQLWNRVLTYEQLKPYLGEIKIFVPNKRKYYIETLYSHYEHTHYSNQLDMTRQVIQELYPDYLDCYDSVMKRSYGYMFNMMIMEKGLLDDYCSWLFNILFEVWKCIDMPKLSAFQGRYYGRIAEIIFNVWLDYKVTSGELKKEQLMEIPYIHMEKINWWKKGTAFLNAKFFGKKYKESF